MRTPRRGDRCEYKLVSVDNPAGETCEERHLFPGINLKGPASLVPCKQGLSVRLLCQRHAPKFPDVPTKRLKRKPGHADAEQAEMFA